jgi:hypothetical protein
MYSLRCIWTDFLRPRPERPPGPELMNARDTCRDSTLTRLRNISFAKVPEPPTSTMYATRGCMNQASTGVEALKAKCYRNRQVSAAASGLWIAVSMLTYLIYSTVCQIPSLFLRARIRTSTVKTPPGVRPGVAQSQVDGPVLPSVPKKHTNLEKDVPRRSHCTGG